MYRGFLEQTWVSLPALVPLLYVSPPLSSYYLAYQTKPFKAKKYFTKWSYVAPMQHKWPLLWFFETSNFLSVEQRYHICMISDSVISLPCPLDFEPFFIRLLTNKTANKHVLTPCSCWIQPNQALCNWLVFIFSQFMVWFNLLFYSPVSSAVVHN